MADHVIHDALAPLKGDDDRVMLVSPLQFVRSHQHLHFLLVQYLKQKQSLHMTSVIIGDICPGSIVQVHLLTSMGYEEFSSHHTGAASFSWSRKPAMMKFPYNTTGIL